MFRHISKRLEIRQKYSAAHRISSFLLGIWKFCETRSFVFGMLLQYIPATQNMMSEMQTRLKYLFDVAIMMTGSK